MGVLVFAFILIWFAVSAFLCQGNIGIGFLLTIGGFIVVMIVCSAQEEEETGTRYASTNSDLENSIYKGLYNDWKGHKTNGNHFVPPEYVAYMEINSRLHNPNGYVRNETSAANAWESWAYAKTNEILIAKGYQGDYMDCWSKYDKSLQKRIDYTTPDKLYRIFNDEYLPLIEFYNQTGEYIDEISQLPITTAKKQCVEYNMLDEFRIDKGSKKYYDSSEILDDIKQRYGNSKYCSYNRLVERDALEYSEEHAFNMLCELCERDGLLGVKASEQKYHDISNKLSSLGSWKCHNCGKEHCNDYILCDCGITKYRSMELEMLDGVERLLGTDTRNELETTFDNRAEYDGRLCQLNIYYPIYEIICKALQFDDPIDGLQYIYDSGQMRGEVVEAYWDGTSISCTDKQQGLKNLCSTMLTCLCPDSYYNLNVQKQII